MKKVLSIALALLLVLGLTAIAKPASADAEEITLWTYPIGEWGKEETVKALTDAFTAETGIKVKVEYLTYTDGDDKVNTALTAKKGPDLIWSTSPTCSTIRTKPRSTRLPSLPASRTRPPPMSILCA